MNTCSLRSIGSKPIYEGQICSKYLSHVLIRLHEDAKGDAKSLAEIADQANLCHQDPLNKPCTCPIEPAKNSLQFSVLLIAILECMCKLRDATFLLLFVCERVQKRT